MVRHSLDAGGKKECRKRTVARKVMKAYILSKVGTEDKMTIDEKK